MMILHQPPKQIIVAMFFFIFKSQSVYLLIFKVNQDSLGDVILFASQGVFPLQMDHHVLELR